MSDATLHVAFFGDGEHRFCLTPATIVELERVTGAGIGLVFARFADLAFSHRELIEIIRLGLVGGGLDPKAAKALVEAYAVPRPIAEVRPLAWDILRALWFGPVEADEPAPATLDEATTSDALGNVTLDADALFGTGAR